MVGLIEIKSTQLSWGWKLILSLEKDILVIKIGQNGSITIAEGSLQNKTKHKVEKIHNILTHPPLPQDVLDFFREKSEI